MAEASRPSVAEGQTQLRVSKRAVALALGIVVLIASVLLSLWQPPRANPFLPLRALSADWWLQPRETNAFLRLATLDASLNAVQAADNGRRVWVAGTSGVIAYSNGGEHWSRQEIDFSALGGPSPGGNTTAKPTNRVTSSLLEGVLPTAVAQQSNAAFPNPRPSKPTTNASPDASGAPTTTGQAATNAYEQVQTPAEPAIRMPNVVGMTLEVARKTIEGAGLGLALLLRQSAIPPGQVIAQEPSAGALVKRGTIVRVIVSEPARSSATAKETRPSANVPPSSPTGVKTAAEVLCDAIANSAERLACYDMQSARSSRTGAKTAPEDRCTAIASSAERLACYDVRTGRSAVTGTKTPTSNAGDATQRWVRPPDLLSLAIAADGKRGVAVGSGGTLIVTSDGGERWKAWRIGSADIRAVAFADTGNELVALDDEGARLLSFEEALSGRTDGARYSRLGKGLKAVWRQGDIWIVFGSDGAWYTSADGKAWAPQQLPYGEFLTRTPIEGGDLIAMLRGPSTTILRRSSGAGDSAWSVLAEIPNERVAAILPLATGHIAAVTASGHYYESTSSGTTWTRGSTAMPVPRAASTGLGTTWLVGNDGAIHSVDRRGNAFPRTSGPNGLFTAVAFDQSDSRAENLWIAAASGLVLRSVDGARTFDPIGSVPFRVKALEFRNALRGSARGELGEEAETEDSGASWTRRAPPNTSNPNASSQSQGVSSVSPQGDSGAAPPRSVPRDEVAALQKLIGLPAPINAAAQAADGVRVAAVGNAGLIVLGDRQLKTFTSPLAPYARGAAPWTYVAGLIALALLAFAALVPPQPKVQSVSVADMLASDKPLERVTRSDPLKLGQLAAGLARFLRNEATEPPLTIAITGAWGSGKSSLMNLLAGEMRRHGISIVTFNAWHHQKEEHLLASLLTAVKDQAPPRWYSLSGLQFRWNLGMARARRAPLVTALLFFVMGAVIYLALNPGPLQPFADLVKRLSEFALNPSKGFDWDVSKIPEKIFGAGALATAVASAVTALRRLRAFGVDPAQLTATLASNFSLKEASAQASFRERFAREFCEVTTAMRSGSRQRVLTIFIDDLDRCRPEAVLEVLEAVNFLVSSGDCYIVLGMARERVEACVGLGFEKVAVELVNLASEGKAGEPDGDEARRQRREYARQYLEKLINIEVPMPVATIAQAQEIIADDGSRDARQGGPFEVPAWLASIASLWPLLLAAALFAAGVGGAQWLARTTPDKAPLEGSTSITSNQGISAEPAPSDMPANAKTAAESAATGSGELRDAQDGSYGWAPVAAMLALAALALAAARLRRANAVVRDSSDFRLALKIWLPVIVLHQNTPRSIKRFINRVRYLAMLRGQPKPGESDPGPVLVMLAALQYSGAPALPGLADFSAIASQLEKERASPLAGAVIEALKLQDVQLHGAIRSEQFAQERRWFEENAASAHMS